MRVRRKRPTADGYSGSRSAAASQGALHVPVEEEALRQTAPREMVFSNALESNPKLILTKKW